MTITGLDPRVQASMTVEQIFHLSDQEFLSFKLPPAVPYAEVVTGPSSNAWKKTYTVDDKNVTADLFSSNETS